MKIIYKDLLNFLSQKPSKDILSNKLFQLGHEHDINEDIFDFELTPNRGDCLSLLGLSRDLNIFFGNTDQLDIFENNIETLNIDFKNLSPSDCPKISFLEIEIYDEISEYKPYLESYFSKLGNKKTNFFTDVSNYVSYELGQPTHCFDLKIRNKQLKFENRVCNEVFKTLHGSEILLSDKNCVFTIENKIISLAGVMGGNSTSCSDETRKALVECAYFNPESIIGKSVKYNLTSDAAYKFERGVDISSQEIVLRRFIKIVEDHALIKNLKVVTLSEKDFEHKTLPIDVDLINKILGTKLSESDYLSYLNDLGFISDSKIKIPSYRHDIKTQNDLAEEIARVIGYDKISSLPLNLKNPNKTSDQKIFKIQHLLASLGLTEVINFPFSNICANSLSIDNPLDSNRANLRICLMDSLIENLLLNERRQKDSIKLFEISDTYTKTNKIVQEKKLGIIVSGIYDHNYVDFSKKLDDQFIKNIFDCNLKIPTYNIIEISRDKLKTKKKDKIFFAEILINDIPDIFFKEYKDLSRSTNFIKYIPVSEFPSSIRDFSFSIKNFEVYDHVISSINNFKDINLKESYIFDFYKNEKIGEIKIGVRLIFQSSLKTLQDSEIQKSINDLLKPLVKIDGVHVPGLELE